jgi:DNA-binding LacI/PurR family transcriptional regulator
MSPKSKSVTISDVAKQAGVSISTVSRVLNGTVPVQQEKADRVRAAMDELQFVPRAAARVLASRRTNTIGLLLPEIGGWFFPSMLRGIEAAARAAGYDLLIHTTEDAQSFKTSRRALGMHNTDGLIVFTNSVDQKVLEQFKKSGFPIVLLHQTPPESLDVPVVTIENKTGAQKLVDHLIEIHNCRRIVYLQGPEGHEDSEWRERGYLESLELHNIPFDNTLVLSGEFDEIAAASAIGQLIIDGVGFDGVFCGDDDAAIGVYAALQRAGRIIPDDVAVAGFDDVPVARFLSPPLTTVRAPTEQVGSDAVSQLVRLIRGERAESLILLPTELVIRQSCGCP